MMHVLFLDFDGVLHPTSGPLSSKFVRANALADCLAGHDCEVIISSSWRHSWTIPELLINLPPALARRVTGVTGDVYIGAYARYHEIQSWLQSHASRTTISWRALDDSGWEFPSGTPELIACNPNTGLADKELESLLQWLRPVRDKSNLT